MVRSVDVLLTTKSAGLDRFVCPVQSVMLTQLDPPTAAIAAAEPPSSVVGPWVMPTFLETMHIPLASSPLGNLRVGDLLRVGTHGGASQWMRLMEIRTDIKFVYNALDQTLDVGSEEELVGLDNITSSMGSAAAVALRLSSPLDCTTLPVKSVLHTALPDGVLQYAQLSNRSEIRLTSTLKVPNPEDCSVVLPDGNDALLPYPLFWKQQASGSAAMRLDRRVKHVLTVELVACTLESMPWVDLQYGHEYERPRLLVVRVESVAGTVLSNDPHLDGAFAVIPLSSDEDARFTGTQQIHRSAEWFAPVSGTLNELKVSVTDQTGAVFTGHWNMHFKLHYACD
jgi:hypothetical protein